MKTIGNIGNSSPRFSESENLSGLRAIADDCWRAVNFIESRQKIQNKKEERAETFPDVAEHKLGTASLSIWIFFSNRGLGWSFGDEEHDELAEIRLRAHAA